MDAATESIALTEAAELAQLRQRAYGRGADIAGDPAARARLNELESARRSMPRVVLDDEITSGRADAGPSGYGAGKTTDEAVAADGRVDVGPTALEPADADQVEAAESAAAAGAGLKARTPPRRPGTPWPPRTLWWGVIGGAAAATAALVAAVVILTPHPTATLQVLTPGEDSPSWSVDTGWAFDHLGLDESDVRAHDEFHGLTAWHGETETAARCLIVTGEQRGVWGVSCAPPPLDPTVDVYKYENFNSPAFGDLPVGSVIRFVLRGDVVDVWIAPAPVLGTLTRASKRTTGA